MQYKFRGKRIDNGEWVYGDLCSHSNGKRYIVVDLVLYVYEVDPKTVGMWTGLKDRRGTDIYSGDVAKNIVRNPSEHPIKYGQILGEVNFKDGGFFIGDSFVLTSKTSKEVEVIGNKFENPELLKSERGER